MQLLHNRAAESFEAIKTVSRTTYRSLKKSTVAKNLLNDDKLW